eukprot:1182861-Prorocentrum_minimum.AAC.3
MGAGGALSSFSEGGTTPLGSATTPLGRGITNDEMRAGIASLRKSRLLDGVLSPAPPPRSLLRASAPCGSAPSQPPIAPRQLATRRASWDGGDLRAEESRRLWAALQVRRRDQVGTNRTREARVYSHDGPIRRRKRGYIRTTGQSDVVGSRLYSHDGPLRCGLRCSYDAGTNRTREAQVFVLLHFTGPPVPITADALNTPDAGKRGYILMTGQSDAGNPGIFS